MPPPELETLVAAWCDLDGRAVVASTDPDIIAASGPLRTVIARFALAGGTDEEIYDACASLGRFIAQRGGSPSLASATIDHAVDALGVRPAPWITGGRAALAEGFMRAQLERVQQDALRSWDFPSCAVALSSDTIAVAAGLPSDDPEVVTEWAASVAKAAALQGVRRAFVAGPDAARAALEDAFDVVGITVAGVTEGDAF
jgi:hypothetical protein